MPDLGSVYFGGVVGAAQSTKFDSIYVSGTYRQYSSFIGGIAGAARDSSISSNDDISISGAHVRTSFDGEKSEAFFGGFIGQASFTTGRLTIVNSSFSGTVSALYVGGAIGQSYFAPPVKFQNVSIRANLSGRYVGGLIGGSGDTAQYLVDSCEIVLNVSGGRSSFGGVMNSLGNSLTVRNSTFDLTSDNQTGTDAVFATALWGGDKVTESGNQIRASLGGATCGAGLYCNFNGGYKSSQKPLIVNSLPQSAVVPELTGMLRAPAQSGKDLLISGSAAESNMSQNQAAVLISIGTSVSDRRFLGLVDASSGEFQYSIPATILANCNGVWDCSKMRVFAQGIDRTGKVYEIPSANATVATGF